jgi:hypothetical protein
VAEDRWYSLALPILELVHENRGTMDVVNITAIARSSGLPSGSTNTRPLSFCHPAPGASFWAP